LFNYELQASARRLPTTSVNSSDYHPLKGITVTEKSAVKVQSLDSKNKQNASKTKWVSLNISSVLTLYCHYSCRKPMLIIYFCF